MNHTPSLLLQNCTNYTSPVPGTLDLPTVTELYEIYQSCKIKTRPPYSYRTVPTKPVSYLHHSTSLMLQNCNNYTSPVPTPLALSNVTELYQIYQSFTNNIRPTYIYRTLPTIPVIYLPQSPSLLWQNCTNYTSHIPTTLVSILLHNCTNHTSPVTTPFALPSVTELYQLH